MEMTDRAPSEYKSSLEKLLPQGVYWENALADKNGDLSKILELRASELAKFRARMNQLLREAFPMSADETIADWERIMLGETHEGQPLSMRRAGLVNQLGFRSIYTIAESEGVSLSLEFPFEMGFVGRAKCGRTQCGNFAALSALRLNVSDATNLNVSEFENSIAKLILANHIPHFVYRARLPRYGSVGELAKAVALGIEKKALKPARLGYARFGRTRLAATEWADAPCVKIPDTNANLRRFDIEEILTRELASFQKIGFAYKGAFFTARRAIEFDGCGSIQEIEQRAGVELSKFFPYSPAKMGSALCGRTRCASVEKANTLFVGVSKFNPVFRLEELETAARKHFGGWLRAYFKYGSALFFQKAEFDFENCPTLLEVAETAGVEISVDVPYSPAKMGRALCGKTRCASVEKSATAFVGISKYNPTSRFTGVETAARRILGDRLHIFFKYGMEVFI